MDILIRSQSVHPATPSGAAQVEPNAGAAEPSSGSAFKTVLEGFGKELDRGQRLMDRVSHGVSGIAPEQLLALQAGVYRYTEVVDLTSKLVDRTCTGLKTTLQSQ